MTNAETNTKIITTQLPSSSHSYSNSSPSSPNNSHTRARPPPITIPLNDSHSQSQSQHSQDLNLMTMSLSLSQQPLCTPVDQVIARTELSAQQPPSPIAPRTTIKRRRLLQPNPSSSASVIKRLNSTSNTTNTNNIMRAKQHRLLLRSDSLDGHSVDNLPPASTTDDDSSLLAANVSSSSQPGVGSSQQNVQALPLPQLSQDTLALLPNIVREHQLAKHCQPSPQQPLQQTPTMSLMKRSMKNAIRHCTPNSNNSLQPLLPQQQQIQPQAHKQSHFCHRSIPNSSSSDALIRASLASALTAAPPMLNPYLPTNSTQSPSLRRLSNASDSFDLNMDEIGNGPNGSTGSLLQNVSFTTPTLPSSSAPSLPSASLSPSSFGPRANSQRRKSLKLLLVSSSQQREEKSTGFDMRDMAGRGAFSEVWRAIHRIDGCAYAIKKNRVPLLSDNARLQALHEVFALAALQGHPNILRYFDAWFEDNGKFLFLQTEFFHLGNLHVRFVDKGTPMAAGYLLGLAHDIASALEFMHGKDMAHVDVKPDNIFCAPNRTATRDVRQMSVMDDVNYWFVAQNEKEKGPKPIDMQLSRPTFILGDFGLACHRDGLGSRATEGDSRYLCPEALSTDEETRSPPFEIPNSGATTTAITRTGQREDAGSTRHTPSNTRNVQQRAKRVGLASRDLCAGDMFSLGATLYELARSIPLDKAGPGWKRLRTHADEAVNEVLKKTGSSLLADVVRKCLNANPKQRATAGEVRRMCDMDDQEKVDLRRQLDKAKQRIQRFEKVLSTLLEKGEEGRQTYRKRTKGDIPDAGNGHPGSSVATAMVRKKPNKKRKLSLPTAPGRCVNEDNEDEEDRIMEF